MNKMAVSTVEYCIVAVVIVVVGVYIWAQINAPSLNIYIQKHGDSLNWGTVDGLLENADNGDLVFMSGETRGEKTCKWCTSSTYSHVGILFREIHEETDEDILYIWDSDLGQKTKDGPRILAMKDKLSAYKGNRQLMWRPLNGKRPTTTSILEVTREFGDQEFDEKILSWWTSSTPFYSFFKDKNKSFCSELVASTLQHKAIGILKTDRVPSWYSPGSFAHSNVEGMKRAFSYGVKTFVDFSAE